MAINGLDFWTQFLNILEPDGRTSDPNYYLPNSTDGSATAQEGEWANVIKVIFERTKAGSSERNALVGLLDEAGFWADTDDLDFWRNQEVNDLDIQDLSNAAEERMPGLFGEDGLQEGDVATVTDPVTGATVPKGMMTGGKVVRIGEGADSIYGMSYTVNGIQHIYTFDDKAQMEEILGADYADRYDFGVVPQSVIDDPDGSAWILGPASAFAGQEGQSYQGYFENVMQEAALEAGVRNPGLLGEYLSRPEIQHIMAMGEAGDWSKERIQAEIRNTDYYLNELYPGISAFVNQGMPDPEAAYNSYMTNVGESLSALGYQKDEFGTFRTQVGQMLTAGISVEAFNQFTPTFVRAESSPQFAAALDRWTQQDLGVSLDFDNWFDVLAGNASPEVAEVVEKATIQFQADLSNTSLSGAQISRLAELTDFSEQQMTLAFSQAEEQLLSVGNFDLARYGLSEQSLVNASFGVDTGDQTATQVRRQARKAATELGIRDDAKAQFFQGFDQFNRPVRTGLAAGSPEAG